MAKEIKVIAKKIYPHFFEEVIKGNKTFELRKEDDTRYEEGDILILKEVTSTNKDVYTGRFAITRIGYVLRDFEGIPDGYAIISLKDVELCDLPRKENS